MNNNRNCENCGKNEATFHYTSNINGNVTEKHLCSECAARLGYRDNMFFDTDRVFENMLAGFFGRRRAFSPFGSFGGFGGFGFGLPTMTMALPRFALPRVEIIIDDGSGSREGENDSCSCGEKCADAPEKTEQAADPEAAKRRELNALNEQMKKYAEAEEFEKAAEIRDQIKKLREEKGEE